jgi:UDP-N-acetylglucosamine 2-epimerase (non-hydrolysing)
MSKVFFEDLELPQPNFYLGVGPGSHAEQTAKIMIGFEKILIKEKPDLILVVGDVNSTIACSLVAVKMNIKIAHVEAGLRSFDRLMPEEINRLLTDSISDFLFVTERTGLNNLNKEGIPSNKIFFVGDVMIDSLKQNLDKIENSKILDELTLTPEEYILITLHRPSNVDSKDFMVELINMLNSLSAARKIVFPIHPRTRKNLIEWNLLSKIDSSVLITEPLGYIDFLSLLKNSELVISDSGGIQSETTFFGVQCLTLRENTEKPVTLEIGTNKLIGTDINVVKKIIPEILAEKKKLGLIPELWDGNTAERIINILSDKLSLINF